MNDVRWTRGGCLGVGGRVSSGLVHVMNAPRLSLFFFLLLFCFCVSFSTQTEELKTGQAWERGYTSSLWTWVCTMFYVQCVMQIVCVECLRLSYNSSTCKGDGAAAAGAAMAAPLFGPIFFYFFFNQLVIVSQ